MVGCGVVGSMVDFSGEAATFGTQFQAVGGRWQLFPVDPETTDKERAAWNVPTLAENLERADRMTLESPPTDLRMPSPTDLVRLMVTRKQLVAGEPLPLEVAWSDEPLMVPIVGLAEIDGLVMLKLDGAGKDRSDLWLQITVDAGLDQMRGGINTR